MHAITSDNHRGRVADGLYARFFSGLADETRLRIVRYLLERPRTVGEIVAALGMSQSRISNHLSCLKWCGYVRAQRQGCNVVYEVADPAIGDLLAIAQRLVAANASHIAECAQVAL
jgi:DNA-binding transcriptional ArsR family regulator